MFLVTKLYLGNDWRLLLRKTLRFTEIAYLSGDFEQIDAIAAVTLRFAKTLLDKIATYETQIQAYLAQNRMIESLQTALNVLKQLGIQLPQAPNVAQILLGLVKTKLILGRKTKSDLLNLPTMSQLEKLAAMHILASAISPAFLAAPKLFPLLTFQQGNMANNTLGSKSNHIPSSRKLCIM